MKLNGNALLKAVLHVKWINKDRSLSLLNGFITGYSAFAIHYIGGTEAS